MKIHADIMQGRDVVLGNLILKGRRYDVTGDIQSS
jgi:hypothetical protein